MTRKVVMCLGAAAAVFVILAKPPSATAQLQAPVAPLNRLFTLDTYTQYTLLDPATQQFRIEFRAEESRVGSTYFDWIRFESQLLTNAITGGSEGSDIEVYDPRTGKPLSFTYGGPSDNYYIRVTLPARVPEAGKGRVLIYKTFKDPRTYMIQGEDIVWTRNLIGYRLGVVLPQGFAFLSSNIAAQLTTQADGRLKLAFANPSGGQSNPVTIHARRTKASFAPVKYSDVFFDDIKTLYDLDTPETRAIRVEQIYSDFRKGDTAKLDSLSYLPLQDLKVIDLDTAKALIPIKSGTATVVKLDVPIANDKQSARIKITGMLKDAGYKVENGELVFDRTMQGLRNTVLLPEGWEVATVSESGTIGMYRGRAFVAFINLSAANNYKVVIRARKRSA